MSDERRSFLRSRIRDVPDFPKEGILFRDITPLLADVEAFVAPQASGPRPPLTQLRGHGAVQGGADHRHRRRFAIEEVIEQQVVGPRQLRES